MGQITHRVYSQSRGNLRHRNLWFLLPVAAIYYGINHARIFYAQLLRHAGGKRQRTAALHDASRPPARRVSAPVFGLRQSSGAFDNQDRRPFRRREVCISGELTRINCYRSGLVATNFPGFKIPRGSSACLRR